MKPRNNGVLIFAVVLVLASLVLTLNAGQTQAQEPTKKGIFESRFFAPNPDIVSCNDPLAKSRCADGWCSTSTGSGTCSSHGGVVGTVNNTSSEETTSAIPTVVVQPTSTPAPSVPEPSQPPADSPVAVPQSGIVLDIQHSRGLLVSGLLVLIVLVTYGAVSVIKS